MLTGWQRRRQGVCPHIHFAVSSTDTACRNLAGFWLLGLFNNSIYCVILAGSFPVMLHIAMRCPMLTKGMLLSGAKEIEAGGVGVVFLAMQVRTHYAMPDFHVIYVASALLPSTLPSTLKNDGLMEVDSGIVDQTFLLTASSVLVYASICLH